MVGVLYIYIYIYKREKKGSCKLDQLRLLTLPNHQWGFSNITFGPYLIALLGGRHSRLATPIVIGFCVWYCAGRYIFKCILYLKIY